MFGDNDFGQTDKRVPFRVLIYFVVLGTVYEANHIGVLLDCTRFTQVGQLRTLSFFSGTGFDATVQLRKGDNGDIQLFCQSFERSRYGTDFLLAAAEIHAAGIH